MGPGRHLELMGLYRVPSQCQPTFKGTIPSRPCEKEDSDSVSLRGGLRFGISNRLPGDALAAGPLNLEQSRG